jgi:predicted ABC-type ATPase
MSSSGAPRIFVLAGVNGAGKSSLGGAIFRVSGVDYYNPDEVARQLMAADPNLSQRQANSTAWLQGRQMLETAVARRLDFVFETTLGANTIPRLLSEAASSGVGVYVWYVGLSSPELHIERVRARVRKGGHDIPEEDIRRRYEHSRLNLVKLLPMLSALRVYDNSIDADPAAGKIPNPMLVLHLQAGKIIGPKDLSKTPDWAKPIVAAAMKLHSQ